MKWLNGTLLFLALFASVSVWGKHPQTSYYYRETKLFFNQIVVKPNKYRVINENAFWARWHLINTNEEDALANYCFHHVFQENDVLKKLVDSIEIKKIMVNLDSANAIKLNTSFFINGRLIQRASKRNTPYCFYTVPIFFLNYNYAISFEEETHKSYGVQNLFLYKKISGNWTRDSLLCSLQS